MQTASEASSAGLMTRHRELRTGAWHGDAPIKLKFPSRWKIITHWPRTPPRLADAEIVHALENPTGQPSLRELLRGKKRPLVLVDDVNRPTPAARIIAPLLKQFAGAGIPACDVTIVIARGSHGEGNAESTLQKIGSQAAASCRVLMHDPYKNTVKIGKTSFGTPVHVNRHVPQADFVMGIGGVYPNNTAGFGGGAKLSLGVLDIRVISQLHNKHTGMGWGKTGLQNTFRQDLEEIARMIGIESLMVGHVDADRELVRLRCGDYHAYYEEEVAFAREAFAAPAPGEADVVISNAFPNDLSLTFVQMKGIYPLRMAAPHASRLALGACSEGEGFHGVFPVVHKSRFHEQYDRLRRISLLSPGEIGRKIGGKVARKIRRNRSAASTNGSSASPQERTAKIEPRNPIWLYRTGIHPDILPSPVKGIRTISDWGRILEIVREEQGGREDVNVVVYPCAPLQIIG